MQMWCFATTNDCSGLKSTIFASLVWKYKVAQCMNIWNQRSTYLDCCKFLLGIVVLNWSHCETVKAELR